MSKLNNTAIITAYYNMYEYRSIELDLSIDDNIKIVMEISENGSNNLNALKLPVSNNRFIVLSKAQLAETILDIEVINNRQEQKSE